MSNCPHLPRIAILGSGSWGSALACLLAPKCDELILYGRNSKTANEINVQHTNAHYLKEISLPENIRATLNLTDVLSSDLILFVVPTSATRATAELLSELGDIPKSTPLISCAKGIERDSGKRMSEIIADFFPNNPTLVLSGPNHAEEVCKRLPTCAVIGSKDPSLNTKMQELISTNRFRAYTSDDVPGIELGGALKNVYAIAAGIADGLGLGDNATAALVTRALAEMSRFGIQLGGRQETFIGLSGVGDLMTTCFSPHSRNNRAGHLLAQGYSLEETSAKLGMVAEGIPNTRSIYEASKNCNARTPIIDEVYAILYKGKSAMEALNQLLTRNPRPECD